MAENIRAEQNDTILQITLDRPDQENLVSDDMAIELTRLLDGAGAESSAVVLRAAGASFCAGWGNYGTLPSPGSVEAYERLKKYDIVFNCYSAFRRCRVPVLGVVQGPARGFGCAIAALCDITVAGDGAVFQVPELSHNILPTMVMSALADRVPLKAINYLVVSGEEIGAQRALDMRLISAVFTADALETAAAALIKRLAQASKPALLGLKDYMRVARTMHGQELTDYARYLHATVNTSSEMRKPR